MDDFDQDHESSSDEQQDQDQDQDDTHTIEDADPMDAEEDDDFPQSDDDQDEDADQDGDQDGDPDPDQDADQDNPDNDDDPTTRVDLPSSTNNNNNKTSSTLNSPSTSSTPRFFRPTVRPEALSARLYDIVPTMAAPQATSINALAITPDLRYWMTGGSDGYVRKYDGPGTINGKQLLTVAQRHPFVDSVVKAGILMSYWENFEPLPTGADGRSRAGDDDKVLSPVYALAVHKDALWSMAGLESGGINIHSVRYDEGKVIHCLLPASGDHDGHTNAVSVLQLTPDEQNVLSGSWDKRILDWDLNTGNVAAKFDGSGSQISAIELRPISGAPIPPEAAEEPAWASETFSSNSNARRNGFFTNGSHEGNGGGAAADAPAPGDVGDGPPGGGGAGSDHESLFGSPGGSLFGEGQMGGGGNAFGGDDDNEFSQAMLEPLEDAPADTSLGGDTAMTDAPPPPPPSSSAPDPAPAIKAEEEPSAPSTQPLEPPQPQPSQPPPATEPDQVPSSSQPAAVHSPTLVFNPPPPTSTDPTQTSATTFLTASIDGTLRVWDRRTPTPLARIATRPGVPPWCMGACWSPSGNEIYAGRRNGLVEEFSIHKATSSWTPERALRFPQGSGAVSAVRAMPNGRHLVCASHDILRLYDLRAGAAFKHGNVPFLIIPGPPRAGVISQLYVDPTSRFMITAAGTRGWEGSCTETIIGYEIGCIGEGDE